jgi:hypothetical protein
MSINKVTLEEDGLSVGTTQLTTTGGGVSVGRNLVVQGNTTILGTLSVGNTIVTQNTVSTIGKSIALTLIFGG